LASVDDLEVIDEIDGDELDVDVRFGFQDRSTGKIVVRAHRCRLVGVREASSATLSPGRLAAPVSVRDRRARIERGFLAGDSSDLGR
jgi:hypothetical protein